jgi:hypothetical protein
MSSLRLSLFSHSSIWGAVCVSGLFLGCGGPPEQQAVPLAAAGPESVDWLNYQLSEAPPTSERILSAKASVTPGAAVTLRGRIGGRVNPFFEGQSAFLLVDSEHAVACDQMGDDGHCSTPWDFCCEDRSKLAEASAIVRFVDAEGQPFPKSLAGVNNWQPGDYVVVVGTVAAGASSASYVVNASGIYLEPADG